MAVDSPILSHDAKVPVTGPLVSVIMPAYNTEAFVGLAIQSVLAQTWPHWELLIINDGSSDNTEAAILAYVQQDARIKYFCTGNTGRASKARNHGLEKALGEYITFLDADDEYLPHALATLVQALQDDPQATSAYAFESTMGETGATLKHHADGLLHHPDGCYTLAPSSLPTWENLIVGTVPHCLSGLMLTRETLQSVGPIDETLTFAEDMQYKIRLFLYRFDGVKVLPQITFRVRIRNNSSTKQADKCAAQVQNEQQFLDWLFFKIDLPVDLSPWCSRKYTHQYRLIAGSRFFIGQKDLARSVLLTAWQDPHVGRADWLKTCSSLFVRCFIPGCIEKAMKAWARKYLGFRPA